MTATRKIAAVEEATRSGRVVLAPLDVSHAPSLFALLNDWEVVRMLSEVPWPLRYEDTEAFLSRPPAASDDFVILATRHEGAEGLPLASDPLPVGVCGVKRPGSGEPPRTMPRLGYWIGRRYWGRGFASQAVAELVDRAFRMHPHDRVGAGVFSENLASQRVLERLGFKAAGTKTVESRSRGEAVETIDLQVTRSEWEAKAGRR